MAVHEEAGSTGQAQTFRLFQAFLHRRGFSAIVQAFIKAISIQLEHAGIGLQLRNLELLAVKKDIVILPELSLLARAAGRLSRFLRSVVDGERKVLVHDCQLVPIFLLKLFQLRRDLLTVRALVIANSTSVTGGFLAPDV